MNETTEFTLFPGSHRLADLARRVPRAAWPFIVLATAQTILFVVLGYGDYRNIAIWVIPTLLPVAVLVGRPDAWRSARVVMVGVIVWGSLEAVVQVLGLSRQRFALDPGTDTAFDFGLTVATRLVSLLAIAAPAIILLGLRLRRRTETTWPKALVAVTIIVTAALCVYDANQAIELQRLWNSAAYNIDLSFRDQLDVLVQGLAPLHVLFLSALAWSTISAVRAQEAPRRFWLAIAAGSSVLFAANLYPTIIAPIMAGGPSEWPAV
jgi:hypothetical protein